MTTVSVPISDDLIVETTEQFFGRILSSGGIMGLEIFAPIASINITDNDSKNGIYSIVMNVLLNFMFTSCKSDSI